MKIMIISTSAIPAPVTNSYGGVEAVTGWQAIEFAKNGNDVTLVTTKGSEWEGNHPIMMKSADGKEPDKQIGTLNVIGTVDPSWTGIQEQEHYEMYRDLLEKEFSNGESIVIDHTWLCFSYLSKMKFPSMNLLHTHHGMLGFRTPPPVLHPRFLGLSTYHAQYISNQLNIPCRYVHNGIPLVQFPPDYDYSSNKGDYLLSLNRITNEKGIHDCIDIAVSTNTPIKIVGDDTKVISQNYVNDIIERCRNSNGLVQYYGLVDNNTKNNLILKCKALIACPQQTWLEAFGLYAVEGMAYGKPILALSNGGLNDIVVHGANGFLAPNAERLKNFVSQIDNIDPKMCRSIVENNFTKEIMAQKLLTMFEKILNKDNDSFW